MARVVIVLAALVLGGALVTIGPAAASGSPVLRHCGTMSGPGARFAIVAYHARCRVARRVFRDLFAGRGHRRKDPATGQVDTAIDGWICGPAAGGFSCGKLHAGKAPPGSGASIGAVAT
jgi:hypothetical protein